MRASAESIELPWGDNGSRVEFQEDVTLESRRDVVETLSSWDQSLFPGETTSVSVLVGGANNRNFTVTSAGKKYALRVANQQNERFAVDRVAAVSAQRAASEDRLAPRIFAAKMPDGHLLSEFIDGETLLETPRSRDADVLRLIGRTFRSLHSLLATTRAFSPFEDIRLWVRLARSDGSLIPAEFERLLVLADQIETAVAACELPSVLCHNDTVPQNFILGEDRLSLVDWDYGGMGLACFELGSFLATADLGADERGTVLAAYDENVTEGQKARVELMGLVAVIREIAWVLMAGPVLKGETTPDEDNFYEDYLRDNLARSRNMLGSQRTQDLLRSMPQWTVGQPW